MHRVTAVQAKPGFVLTLTFEDGLTGDVDVGHRLHGPVFEPVRDPAFFRQVFVDDYGAVCWPNRADLSPDVLYSEIDQRLRA